MLIFFFFVCVFAHFVFHIISSCLSSKRIVHLFGQLDPFYIDETFSQHQVYSIHPIYSPALIRFIFLNEKSPPHHCHSQNAPDDWLISTQQEYNYPNNVSGVIHQLMQVFWLLACIKKLKYWQKNFLVFQSL